jgi:hypothetical protein
MGKYSGLKIGDKYNNWTVDSECYKDKNGSDVYMCNCICGERKQVEGKALILERSKSCGCIKRVNAEEQKKRIKEYKAKYFQENKDKIYKRTINNQRLQREKDIQEFGIDRYSLKSRYNISLEQYKDLLDKQNNKCCLCNVLFDKEDNSKRPCVDHNHETQIIR